jgi:hypothetical protein
MKDKTTSRCPYCGNLFGTETGIELAEIREPEKLKEYPFVRNPDVKKCLMFAYDLSSADQERY